MNILEYLQSAGEGTKKTVLVAGSVLAMALVIVLWLTVSKPLFSGADAARVSAGANEQSHSSFLANIKNGASALAGWASSLARSGVNALTGSKSYTIQPEQANTYNQ